MANRTKQVKTKHTKEQLPLEWQEKARKAAKQFNLPMPTDQELGTAQEAEERLRRSEQEGGE